LFDTSKAQKKLKAFVEASPRTIEVTAKIMVDHFLSNVWQAKKLKGKAKQLVLRTTCNRRALVHMFGADTKNWRGKTITIYHDPDVKFGGKLVGGIRIKETKA
jgi:hypothetical protein